MCFFCRGHHRRENIYCELSSTRKADALSKHQISGNRNQQKTKGEGGRTPRGCVWVVVSIGRQVFPGIRFKTTRWDHYNTKEGEDVFEFGILDITVPPVKGQCVRSAPVKGNDQMKHFLQIFLGVYPNGFNVNLEPLLRQ